MKIIVNRIEDGVATVELENGKTVNLPAILFEDFKEGDTLILTIEKANDSGTADTQKIFDKLRNKSNNYE